MAAALPPCWKCKGAGVVLKVHRRRDRVPGQPPEETECFACHGKGSVPRAKKRGHAATGSSSAPKRVKSFPLWIPSGPDPAVSPLSRSLEDIRSDPAVPDRLKDAATGIPEDCRWDPMSGKWCIAQPIFRHKYSTDDVITAWVAARVTQPTPCPSVVDIGCGVGSVLLFTAWCLPTARGVGVEAQATRSSLAERSCVVNGVDDRLRILSGDLRSEDTPSRIASNMEELFHSAPWPGADLVTGTPPYFDPKMGALPADEETTSCLFEDRGGIEEYCTTAAALLRKAGVAPAAEGLRGAAGTEGLGGSSSSGTEGRDCEGNALPYPPHFSTFERLEGCSVHDEAPTAASSSEPWWRLRGGRFVVVETALATGRTYHAAYKAGLFVEERWDLYGRAGKPTLISVFVMAHLAEATPSMSAAPKCGKHRVEGPVYGERVLRISVRPEDKAGSRTPAYRRLLAEMGRPAD
jgi:tRNA1(Val) A37 N6-methylase TrmN6